MNNRYKVIEWLIVNNKELYYNKKLQDDYLYKIQTWLRKEYHIHIVVEPYDDRYKCTIFRPNKFGYAGDKVHGGEIYAVSVPDCDFSGLYEDCYTFEFFEDALACGILEILKTINNE